MRDRASRPWIGALLNYSRAAVFVAVAALLCLSARPENQLTNADLERIVSEARTQVNKIKYEPNHLILLENLASTEARLGNIQFALSEAERLEPIEKAPPNFGNCDWIYQSVSRAQMRAGDTEGAIQTAQRMQDKVSALYYLAEELANERMVDRAVTLVGQMGKPLFPRDKPKIFLELAVITAKNGDGGRANELFDRAESLVADLQRQRGARPGFVDLSLDIAASRQLCGDRLAAVRMFRESRELILGIKDESLRDQFLAEFVRAAAKAGGLDLAREVSLKIEDPINKLEFGAVIIRGYLDNGVYDIEAAQAILSTIPRIEERAMALSDIASMQVRKGDKDSARKTIERCRELLKNVDDDWRIWTRISLARVEYELGDRDQGARLFDEAAALSNEFTIHRDRQRSMVLSEIVRIRAEFGDEVGALRTAWIEPDASFFEDIAETEAHRGNADLALRWVRKLKDPEVRARSLLGVVSGILDTQEDSREPKSVANPRCN
jgi:tetratricopeptide (TPR) repeat protein